MNTFVATLVERHQADLDTASQQLATVLDVKREEAIRYLGENRVGTSGYKLNPRHANNPSIYGPARAQYLASVRLAAQISRNKNPAYQRAVRVAEVLASE